MPPPPSGPRRAARQARRQTEAGRDFVREGERVLADPSEDHHVRVAESAALVRFRYRTALARHGCACQPAVIVLRERERVAAPRPTRTTRSRSSHLLEAGRYGETSADGSHKFDLL